jgi:hypothetical protein
MDSDDRRAYGYQCAQAYIHLHERIDMSQGDTEFDLGWNQAVQDFDDEVLGGSVFMMIADELEKVTK